MAWDTEGYNYEEERKMDYLKSAQNEIIEFRIVLGIVVFGGLAMLAWLLLSFAMTMEIVIAMSAVVLVMVLSMNNYNSTRKHVQYLNEIFSGKLWPLWKSHWYYSIQGIKRQDLEQMPEAAYIRSSFSHLVLLRDAQAAVQLRLIIE